MNNTGSINSVSSTQTILPSKPNKAVTIGHLNKRGSLLLSLMTNVTSQDTTCSEMTDQKIKRRWRLLLHQRKMECQCCTLAVSISY
ncbi:unnamed protein product [Allacma fusca]|uniref:Uncharacterized protein n=1 Tax=Allacma fusca TaxID=39272 RepID=A0A8J2NZD1_9HEXA|nr:unnamed protein product [Allacma fusca]